MARLPDPLSTLSPDARRVYDKITAKRGQMKGGPFASLMHHPALAEKVSFKIRCRATSGCPGSSSWSRAPASTA
jgi:hypothetical protein